jgi:hypothetical protein
MIDSETLKWFARGFVLTSVIFLAVVLAVRPTIGWAQGGGEGLGNKGRPVVDDTPPDDPGTDDPTGQMPVTNSSVVDSGVPRSNKTRLVSDEPPDDPGTDDPTGQMPVTDSSVVDSSVPRSNQTRSVSDEPPDDPGTDEGAAGAGGIAVAGDIGAQGYGSPLVIPVAAFSSDGFDPDSSFFSFSGGYIRGTAAADGCIKAPAYLPDGATITSVYAYLYDNDSSRNAYIDVRRVRNLTGVQNTMASVSTSAYGNSTSIRYLGDTTVAQPVVDDLYSYYVTSCVLSTNVRLYAVRIFYTE